jgi:hypothetical protein
VREEKGGHVGNGKGHGVLGQASTSLKEQETKGVEKTVGGTTTSFPTTRSLTPTLFFVLLYLEGKGRQRYKKEGVPKRL